MTLKIIPSDFVNCFFMQKGKVKWFNSVKGFGFVSAENGEDVFIHITTVEKSGLNNLQEGQDVSFEIQEDRRGRMAVSKISLL